MKTKSFILLMITLAFVVSSVPLMAQKLVNPGTWRNWRTYTGTRDTLNNSAFGDTISAYNPASKFQIISAEVGDIANSSVDSLRGEVKGPTGAWTPVALKNLETGSVGAYAIPGDGKTVLFEFIAEYKGEYRLRRVNTYKARIKSYVTFEAVSP